MVSLTSNEFLTNRAWHRAVVGVKEMILRHTSALEFLELFSGYMREKRLMYTQSGAGITIILIIISSIHLTA